MVAAFGEGFGDGKTKFGVKGKRGGVVGFDAEDNGFVPGCAGGFDEGGEQGFAEALSLCGGVTHA